MEYFQFPPRPENSKNPLEKIKGLIPTVFKKLQRGSLDMLEGKKMDLVVAGLLAFTLTLSSCDKKLFSQHGVTKEVEAPVVPFNGKYNKKGEHNFSYKNVEEQKEWLKNWITNRSSAQDKHFSKADFRKLKTKMLENLNKATVWHVPNIENLEDLHYAGQHYGDTIVLNEKVNNNNFYKTTPLHEFDHQATRSGKDIPLVDQKIISRSLKNKKAFTDFIKNDLDGLLHYGGYYGGDKIIRKYEQFRTPNEFMSMFMELRKEFNLSPKQLVDDAVIDEMYKAYKDGKLKRFGSLFSILMIKDKKAMKYCLNNLVSNDSELVSSKDLV